MSSLQTLNILLSNKKHKKNIIHIFYIIKNIKMLLLYKTILNYTKFIRQIILFWLIIYF